jgi:uncharacterized protein
MKSLAALISLLLVIGASALPAAARDSYVIDNAHLFSADTIASINAKVADFYATAHKEVFVETEPTVDGTPQAAAEKIFAAQQVNGVLIYIAKSPKTIGVVPDRAASQFFPPTSTSAIRTAIKSAFNSGDFNGGITNGVDMTLSEYRSHLGALTHRTSYAPIGSETSIRSSQAGFGMHWIWILIILAVIFFVIRGIFRAMAGPRVMPPGYGGGPMMGGGYGPGYGGGYGGGGGGSFWSGLMGGLGGAFLGNELFGRRDDFGGNQAGFVDQGQGGGYQQPDTSGFQSDPGQADMGNASFGGWGGGDSGGGWGGGDSGGGDSGGGWGGGGDNSGGGW